jgi:hypothetical protein
MSGDATASHSRTDLSSLALATRCPSGLNVTRFTPLVWHLTGSPIGWPVSGFRVETGSVPQFSSAHCRGLADRINLCGTYHHFDVESDPPYTSRMTQPGPAERDQIRFVTAVTMVVVIAAY